MNMILSADLNWGIGYKNELLFHFKADMRYFKEKTINNTVIMGYNTLVSLPNSQPLVNRRNIVLAPEGTEIGGVEIANSIEQALALVKNTPPEQVFIIGGESVYKQFLPLATKIYVTRFYAAKTADTYFTNLDNLKDWQKVKQSEPQSENGVDFSFDVYEKSC